MKKKLVAVLMASVMACGLWACGGSSETKEETKTEATDPQKTEEKKEEKLESGKVDKISIDNEEGTLTYTKHEITTDFEGKPAILVYFDYTNKKSETSYSQETFYPQLFQNGVECEIGIAMNDNESVSNTSKEIQGGTTINVAFMYTLQDTENPVTMKVTDQSQERIFEDYYQEQELNVK